MFITASKEDNIYKHLYQND